ncbi:MAG TPA: T9SS type A sorting domain-containing protein, partial [Bacteroidales bacterium]|nr:T9SS type A sorting domain-containing protein [Bacteroidales bacterium]
QNGNKFSNLLLGTYTITATHTNGCTYEMDYEVILDPAYLPVAQLLLDGEDKDIAVCWDADLLIPTLVHDLNNIPGHEYLFSIIVPTNVHIQGSNAIKILTPGAYRIGGSVFNKVTGCGDTTWHWVYANATPTIDITYDGACMGTDIVLTANATPALDAPHSYTYSWTSSLTGDTILGTEATLTRALTGDVTFTVVVTAHYHYTGVDAEGEPYSIDLECPATQNIFIEPDPVPEFELEVLNKVEHCNSDTPGKIGISSGWDVNHTWTARLLPDGTPFEVNANNFDVTVGGTYEVKAVSVDECEYIKTIFVDSLLVGFDAILHAYTDTLDPDLDYSDDLAFCWTNTNKTIFHEVRYTNKPIFAYEYTINTPLQILQQSNQSSIVTEPGDYMLVGWVINITTGCRSKNDTLYVYAVETPQFDISPDPEICRGDEIKIGIVPTDTFNVVWTGNNLTANTDSVTITPAMYGSAASYTATVEVSNNHAILACTVTEQVEITIHDAPVIAPPALVTNVSCPEGSDGEIELTVYGSDPFGISWTYSATSGGTTTTLETTGNPLTGLKAGYYVATIIDNNGCQTVSDEIEVTQPAPITHTSTLYDYVSCFGLSDGKITIGVTGGTPGYIYTLENPVGTVLQTCTTGVFIGVAAGTYAIRVTDSKGCEKVFTGFEMLEPNQLTATFTITPPDCYGGTGTIKVNPTGGTPVTLHPATYNYLWSNDSTTQQITAVAGTYYVTVTDKNGCTYIDSATIEQPSDITLATSLVTDVACYGGSTGSIQATATGGTPGTAPDQYFYTLHRVVLHQYPVPPSYVYVSDNTTGTFNNLEAGLYRLTVKDFKDCSVTFSFVVDQPDEPLAATVDPDDVTHINCHGGATGAATVTVSGGTIPYHYLWSNNDTTASITGLIAGDYYVTVTDKNGCLANTSVTITQLDEITLESQDQVNIKCYGQNTGSISVGAEGGSDDLEYSIDGTNYQDDGDFISLSAGDYTIRVRDKVHPSCYKDFDFTLTEPDNELTVTLNLTNPLCFDGTGTIEANPAGGTPGYTYKWSNDDNTKEITGLTADSYTVTVTDANLCTASASATVVVPSEIEQHTSTHITDVACYGEPTGKIEFVATGGTPGDPDAYTYVLGLDTNSTGVFENLYFGTYDFQVIDANDCLQGFTIQINQPNQLVVSAEITDSIPCHGENATVKLNAAGGTLDYTYTLGTHTNDNGEFNVPAGTYKYCVEDANGCVTDTLEINVTQPDPLTADANVTAAIQCHGGTATVTITVAGGTLDYTYTFDGTEYSTNEFTVLAGTYEYSVKDANGCFTPVQEINVSQPQALTVYPTIVDVKCHGEETGSIKLTVNGGTTPYYYTWDPTKPDTNFIENLTAGTYEITVTDANGCNFSTSYYVAQPNEINVTFNPVTPPTICYYSFTTVTANAEGGSETYTDYEWSNGFTGPSVDLGPGSYTVVVTDDIGCVGEGSITINAHPVPVLTTNEPPQVCNYADFQFIFDVNPAVMGDITAETWDAVSNTLLGSNTNTLLPPVTYGITNYYEETELYVKFTYEDGNCTYTHTTDTIKISGEPYLRIYHNGYDDNTATITQNDSIRFHFMVDDLCNADDDLRLAIDYQIYKDGILIDTFSNYFSTSESMNFFMDLNGTDMTYGPFDYNLDLVDAHFPYNFIENGVAYGAVLGGVYRFDFFFLRFLGDREGTITLDYLKVPGEYVIDFQLVSHYKNNTFTIPHGNQINVFMNTGRVGGNHFYEGTEGVDYFVRTLSTNTMTITVEPNGTPVPASPTTFERDVTVDPASLTVEMRIYPNPTTPSEEVKIALTNLSSDGILSIASMNGLVLEQYQIKDLNNHHEIVLKVNNYAPGIYFVTYRSKEGLVTKKLVIQSR